MGKKQGTEKTARKTTAANIGFEAKLWEIAGKLRGNLEPAVHKHDVLGLIFLKYISDRFMSHRAQLESVDGADPEDRDEYTADNVFWVPKGGRWADLQQQARQETIGVPLDAAMTAIEKENDTLKAALPDTDWRNEQDRPRQYEWLASRMAKLIEAVSPHIGDAAQVVADSDEGDDESTSDDREQA